MMIGFFAEVFKITNNDKNNQNSKSKLPDHSKFPAPVYGFRLP